MIFKFDRSAWIWPLAALALAAPGAALAVDLEVTCEAAGDGVLCDSSPLNEALFDEDDLKPGDTVVRDLRVTNDYDRPCAFELDTENETVGTSSLADKLFAVIRDTADRYGTSDGAGADADKTMADAFAAGPIGLGTLAGDSVTDYEWAVTFDKDTGNDWQGEETTFDFVMKFTCEEDGEVLGVADEEEPPAEVGGLLDRFPAAGALSRAKWLQGSGADWSRLLAGLLAAFLSVYVVLRFVVVSLKARRRE